MKLQINIHPNDIPALAAGEIMMQYLNPNGRWGYNTEEAYVPLIAVENDQIKDLTYNTICCGSYAKTGEYSRVAKYHIKQADLDVYLYWDGDGTIVFHHLSEGWSLYNTDMKSEDGWQWLSDDDWTKNLEEDYYYEEITD